MRKTTKSPGKKIVKDIKRAVRKQYSAEEKIRIVQDGLRGEYNIAELCRGESISQVIYYRWLKDFMEAEGRSISELEIHIGAVNDRMEASMVEAYAEAGVTQLLIPFLRQGSKHLDANLENIQPFVEVARSIS